MAPKATDWPIVHFSTTIMHGPIWSNLALGQYKFGHSALVTLSFNRQFADLWCYHILDKWILVNLVWMALLLMKLKWDNNNKSETNLMSHFVVVCAIIWSGPRSCLARRHLVTPGVRISVPVGALIPASFAVDSKTLGQVVVGRIGLRVKLRGLQDVRVDLHLKRRFCRNVLKRVYGVCYRKFTIVWYNNCTMNRPRFVLNGDWRNHISLPWDSSWCYKISFGGNLDFPKIKTLIKVTSEVWTWAKMWKCSF